MSFDYVFMAAGRILLIQLQLFNSFLDSLYEKFNNEYLEILETHNNTETDQNL
ncbi:7093_t:CDS:2, partial [Cetraspora pellucida]